MIINKQISNPEQYLRDKFRVQEIEKIGKRLAKIRVFGMYGSWRLSNRTIDIGRVYENKKNKTEQITEFYILLWPTTKAFK